MGRTGSSSKKKSSKKKIPKISSEARRRKRSRKSKSKKLRRDEDSGSYSDHESSSSLSVSSSSSGDDYRSRKSRSRTRDAKGSKKRARRSSSSRGSRVDSLPIKKKKRKGDSESRKKLSKKKKTKKRRRDSSVSLDSSDTHSCSTCQGGSDSESESLRERSREKKKSKRKSGKGRSITTKRRDRSRSSSCSKLSDSVGNDTIELFAVENNSRRLRSVITVVTREMESEGGNEENKDEFKEEIVYDHDDYPSCRSNDSNEAGNKRESAHRTVENVIGEEPSVSNLKASEPILTPKNGSNKFDGLERSFDGAGNVSPKEKESDVKDLEVILRQQALENLKRFRGGPQRNEVVPADEENKSNSEIKPPSNVEPEFVPNKLAVENLKRFRGESQINKTVPLDEKNKTNNEIKLMSTGEAEFVQNNQLKQEDPGIMGAAESALRRSRFTWRRDSSLPTRREEKIPPKKNGGTDSAAAKLKDATLRHLGFPGPSKEKARNVRPLASRLQTLPRENSSLASRLQTLPRENSSLTDSTVNKSAHKSADGASGTLAESSTNTREVGISDAHGSSDHEGPSSVLAEEDSSREQQNDTKDGSQFEQKTMTVMRGGELVQVSYKVYIPKKVPALARRLKR